MHIALRARKMNVVTLSRSRNERVDFNLSSFDSAGLERREQQAPVALVSTGATVDAPARRTRAVLSNSQIFLLFICTQVLSVF